MLLEQLKRFTHGLVPVKPILPPKNRVRVLDQGRLGPFGLGLDAQGAGRVCWENEGHIWTLAVGQQVNSRLAPIPHGEGGSPCIAMSPAGKGLLAWLTEADGITEINALGLGRPVGEPQRVFSTTGRIHHLQLTADRGGNGLLVWLHELHDHWRVLSLVCLERGQVWAAEPTVLGPATRAARPCLATNAQGQAMALWEMEHRGAPLLVASHFEPSVGSWSERPSPVTRHGAWRTQLALDGYGNALLLWVQARREERCLLQASVYSARTYEWSSPETLCTAEIITNARLAMTETGQAMAAWCQAEGLGATRLVVKARNEGRWEEGVECLELGQEPVREFALGLRPDGMAGLVSMHHGAEEDWTSLRLRRAAWSSAVRLLAPPTRLCTYPQLKLWSGGASALWTQGVGRDRVLVLSETW